MMEPELRGSLHCTGASFLFSSVLLFLLPQSLESLLHVDSSVALQAPQRLSACLPAVAFAPLQLCAVPWAVHARHGGRQYHRSSLCSVALGLDGSATARDAPTTVDDSRTRGQGGVHTSGSVVKKMKRVNGRRAALDPLWYAGGLSSVAFFQRSLETHHGEALAEPQERQGGRVETAAYGNARLEVESQKQTASNTPEVLRPQKHTPAAGDFFRRPMTEVTASAAKDYLAVLNDQTASRLPQFMVRRARKLRQRAWADASTFPSSAGVGTNVTGVFSAQLARQMSGVEDLLANRPFEHGDASRIANGELQLQQMWAVGPALLLTELFRAMVLLATVLQQAITLTILVMGLVVRSAAWVFEWAMAVGDAKEWWVPDAVEYVADKRATAKYSRTLAYLRYARSRSRMLLLLIYRATAAAVSPAVVLKGEKWVRDLRDVLAEQATHFVATAQVALTESSLSDSGEPQTVFQSTAAATPGSPGDMRSRSADDAVRRSSTSFNTQILGSPASSPASSSYDARLEATRARSAQRLTQ